MFADDREPEILSCGGYNAYIADTGAKRFLIGGMPEIYSERYAEFAASADAVVCLTSKPEFIGGLDRVLGARPDIEVYASAAGLRNVKAILNRGINERLIKDNAEEAGMRFLTAPCLPWVDTVVTVCGGILFSGEMFSGFDGTKSGLKEYFDRNLSVNSVFAAAAARRLDGINITRICPSYGMPYNRNGADIPPREIILKYIRWCQTPPKTRKSAVVVFHSRYGFTKSLAERAAKKLAVNYDTRLFDVSEGNIPQIITAVNSADLLALGTNTENRNIPRGIWQVITGLDLVNKRGTPYFVFGSFGWAGDAIKIADTLLANMGMHRASKPVEVLFKPTDEDFTETDKAVERCTEYEHKYCKDE